MSKVLNFDAMRCVVAVVADILARYRREALPERGGIQREGGGAAGGAELVAKATSYVYKYLFI